jgi:hypothetical protein
MVRSSSISQSQRKKLSQRVPAHQTNWHPCAKSISQEPVWVKSPARRMAVRVMCHRLIDRRQQHSLGLSADCSRIGRADWNCRFTLPKAGP